MDKVRSRKLAMYLAVQVALQAAADAVGIAGLTALLDVLKTKLDALFELTETQTQTTAGKTARRDEVVDDMAAATLEVAGLLRAHAHAHGLVELAATAAITPSSFVRMRMVERPVHGQRIHDAALPHAVALAPLGAAVDMLPDLQAKIDAARAIINEPRTTIVKKAVATRDVAALCAEIDALLEHQVDGVMFPLRRTQPALHARYVAARDLVGLPSRHAAEPAPDPSAPPDTATQAATSALSAAA